MATPMGGVAACFRIAFQDQELAAAGISIA
jgi:hypothetical protein